MKKMQRNMLYHDDTISFLLRIMVLLFDIIANELLLNGKVTNVLGTFEYIAKTYRV